MEKKKQKVVPSFEFAHKGGRERGRRRGAMVCRGSHSSSCLLPRTRMAVCTVHSGCFKSLSGRIHTKHSQPGVLCSTCTGPPAFLFPGKIRVGHFFIFIFFVPSHASSSLSLRCTHALATASGDGRGAARIAVHYAHLVRSGGTAHRGVGGVQRHQRKCQLGGEANIRELTTAIDGRRCVGRDASVV